MITLDTALTALERIAPLAGAAPWDNVGLLVEPVGRSAPVRRVMLCIDLTVPVFEEAAADEADLIVAYHPLIFGGLKRLNRGHTQQRTVIDAIRQGIAIYSPHTAADAVAGGVCDWLIDGLGPIVDRAAIEPAPSAEDDAPPSGMGRRGTLSKPTPLADLLPRLKTWLSLPHLRVATSARHAGGAPISTVAVCPGAGGSLFEKVGPVDLLVTGEMRHHDVLARVAAGTTVVLTEHTNCERGWLERLKAALDGALGGGVAVRISTRDRDPLTVR